MVPQKKFSFLFPGSLERWVFDVLIFTGIFYGFYHGKFPLNHHLGNICKSKLFVLDLQKVSFYFVYYGKSP